MFWSTLSLKGIYVVLEPGQMWRNTENGDIIKVITVEDTQIHYAYWTKGSWKSENYTVDPKGTTLRSIAKLCRRLERLYYGG
jgi:hypothetical protein